MAYSSSNEMKLEDKFFKVLNEIRGHLSIEEYKNVYLLLLYLKYLNDTAKIKGHSNAEIVIPEIAKWKNLIVITDHIGDYLNRAFYELDRQNPKFHGIFSVFDFNTLSYNKDLGRGLKTIIHNLSEVDLSKDEINFGDIFDYLLYGFIRHGGKNSVGIILPPELVELMTSFIPTREKLSIYNPFSGLSSFAINLPDDSHYIGQEINVETRSIAILRLFAHNKSSFEIEQASSIGHNYAALSDRKFDCIISAPPLGTRLNNDQRYGTESEQRTYEAFAIEKGISSLKNNGKAIFAVSYGFLFGSGPEKKLREKLVKSDLIEMVVALPSGILHNSSVSICLLVLNKNKLSKDEIFFVDGTHFFIGKKAHNSKLDLEKISKIIEQRENSVYSNLINNESLVSHEYNLSPRRYIQFNIKKDLIEKENIVELSSILSGVPRKRGAIGALGRFVRIRDLSDSFKNYKRNFEEIEINEVPKFAYSLPSNSLLLASRWNNMKPTYFSKSDDDSYCSPDILAFKINEKLIYLPYLLQELREAYVEAQFVSYSPGTTIPFISAKDILRIKISIPSFEKQKEQVLYRLALIATTENLKTLKVKEELAINKADQDSFLRHQIAGSLRNARMSFEAVKSIVENQIVNNLEGVLELKKNETSTLTLGKYLEIIERDLKSIHNSIQLTGKELDFADFNPVEIDIVKFTYDYYSELKERKGKVFEVDYSPVDEELKEAEIKKVLIYGDKELLRKLFDNIIENAEKHAFDHKGSIKNRINFLLMFDFDDMKVQLDISNTGNPLPEDYSHEAFIRKGSKAGSNGGDGFGGWYMNEIMKKHDGKFDFTDETEAEGLYGRHGFDLVTSIELTFPIKVEL